MDQPQSATPLYTVMHFINHIQAWVVGLYFAGAWLFSLCTLRKARLVSRKRRRSILISMLTVLGAYMIEVVYHFTQSTSKRGYEAPQPAVIRCLGSILVWSFLTFMLWSSKALCWHAYSGVFVLQFALETTTCLLTALSTPESSRHSNMPFVIGCVRATASLTLLLDACLILVTKQAESASNKERQSLLEKESNSSGAPNKNAGYGTVPTATASDKEDAAPEDDNKEIKAQQAKRLEEEGGWFGYLKGFAVFLPYLFPRDDWKVMACLGLRLVHVLQERIFNLLTPRQLGVITNKLQQSYDTESGIVPWGDIGLWVLFSCISSYACSGVLDGIAELVISNCAYRRITLLAYGHVLDLSMDFHTSKNSGEVLKAIEQAASLSRLIQMVLFDMAPILLDLVIAMHYVAHLFDAYMAFIILFMGAAYIATGFHFTTLAQPKQRDYVEKQRTESSTVNETVHNWQTVAYFNRPEFERKRYADNITATISAQYSYFFWTMGGQAAQDALIQLGLAGACIFGMSQIVTGRRPVGNLFTLIMYWYAIVKPLYVISHSYQRTSSLLVDAERLLQLLNTKPTVIDQDGARDIAISAGEVVFRDVEFHYDKRTPIYKSLNLKAGGGQTIAFVGETGGGKSTMLKLLFRLYDVTRGSIMIDGQDLRSVTQASLRDAIGLVPQDPVLFNHTIRHNIRYAKLDASDSEIEDACRAAAIHDDIVGFPDGYKSKVGERGVRLSGGQLQRIAIARVLLKNPKIVMLDEATSAIDSSTEALVQQAFCQLSQGRTTFVIAHRLSTTVNADQILVVDKGEIIERGTHQELLENQGGKYAGLWSIHTAGHLSKTP
ncbi:Heavy metal tolerance protein [Alternaria tenuissima]|nr:Heavy metal tolerance protein [Alternaria tenuissima]RYN24974.1 Heavy metal tolerance protein [Alternaria tenuissima]RYN80676.1 Heavy metal tolerance protein [Alternaria tenuissima]RYO00479.1 Heavy metal tolerance protein [Alternaria tenuissima]